VLLLLPPGAAMTGRADTSGRIASGSAGAQRHRPQVVTVWLHLTTGAAGCAPIWNHAGGPAAGGPSIRLLDPDRPEPHDGGEWSAHTVDDVEHALRERGFRLVTRAEAAAALREAGYQLGNERAYGHCLYADEVDDAVWWEKNYNQNAFALARP
jgi:hypothetical protein